MNRKISILNPIYPYSLLFIIIALLGFVFTKQQFDPLNLGHPVMRKDQLDGALIAIATILFCLRLAILYILPKRDWQAWARQHNGHYSHPANLQVQPYGMVLDMLEGKDDMSGKPFVIMRTVQISHYLGTLNPNKSVARRFVVLAEPEGDMFSMNSRDGAGLTILKAKNYMFHVPSYAEMSQPTL